MYVIHIVVPSLSHGSVKDQKKSPSKRGKCKDPLQSSAMLANTAPAGREGYGSEAHLQPREHIQSPCAPRDVQSPPARRGGGRDYLPRSLPQNSERCSHLPFSMER